MLGSLALVSGNWQWCWTGQGQMFQRQTSVLMSVHIPLVLLPSHQVWTSAPNVDVKLHWSDEIKTIEARGILSLSCLSRSLADRWGTTVDFTTSFLHYSRFSAFRSMIFHSRPVVDVVFPSFPLSAPSSPSLNCSCRIVLASPASPYNIHSLKQLLLTRLTA